MNNVERLKRAKALLLATVLTTSLTGCNREEKQGIDDNFEIIQGYDLEETEDEINVSAEEDSKNMSNAYLIGIGGIFSVSFLLTIGGAVKLNLEEKKYIKKKNNKK